MINFGEKYNTIKSRRINKDINSDDEKTRQIALAIKMINECNFRIGNEKYEKEIIYHMVYAH